MRRGKAQIDRYEFFLNKAIELFDSSAGQVSGFIKQDPFNPDNEVGGIISKKDGPMGGSLLITEVNNKRIQEPLLIYGTPKLAYPYTSTESTEYMDFTKESAAVSCFFANKWNGANILFFKYVDADGKTFISAKSKGSAFLSNSQYGEYLSMTLRALKGKKKAPLRADSPPPLLRELADPQVQSKAFELCGKDEPHLVAYDFALELKPLFLTYQDGSIAPAVGSNKEDIGPVPFDPSKLAAECRRMQEEMLKKNEQYRAARKLPHRYERDHFAVEGRVLYLLDAKGRLLNRTMYKIKPPDVEEVHWSSFDATMQGRVREALEKIHQREKAVNEESLRQELDMGPKEWSRFGKSVLSYAMGLSSFAPPLANDERRVLLLIGAQDRATAVADGLAALGWTHIRAENSDQTEAGVLARALRKGGTKTKIVLQAPLSTGRLRHPWLHAAQEQGVIQVDALVLDGGQQEDLQKPNKKEGFAAMYASV